MVKTYTETTDFEGGGMMEEDPSGRWVSLGDYKSLESKLEENADLERERDDARNRELAENMVRVEAERKLDAVASLCERATTYHGAVTFADAIRAIVVEPEKQPLQPESRATGLNEAVVEKLNPIDGCDICGGAHSNAEHLKHADENGFYRGPV